eukprot:GEMP01016787.1.p1 GENE.GEMP01016787.1~~GEMP01016787.1.p1  ORF type:complete len:789 (+),score=146.47 GEMP01016787.1:30-2369(+)
MDQEPWRGEPWFGEYAIVRRLRQGNRKMVALVKKYDGDDTVYASKMTQVACLSIKDRHATLREADLLQRLTHTNIVGYVDSFLEAESFVIVMEYCEDGDLKQVCDYSLQLGHTISQFWIRYWTHQTLCGLAYVHSRNCLHRDLKTSNIFLRNKGSEVKLGDFGVSNTMEDAHCKSCVGTPSYMSPEICQNIPYTQSVDMWSIGIILYELSVLRLPFEGASLLGLIHAINTGTYEALPYPAGPIIDALLEKEPDKRPTAADMMAHPWFLSMDPRDEPPCPVLTLHTPPVVPFIPTFIPEQCTTGTLSGLCLDSSRVVSRTSPRPSDRGERTPGPHRSGWERAEDAERKMGIRATRDTDECPRSRSGRRDNESTADQQSVIVPEDAQDIFAGLSYPCPIEECSAGTIVAHPRSPPPAYVRPPLVPPPTTTPTIVSPTMMRTTNTTRASVPPSTTTSPHVITTAGGLDTHHRRRSDANMRGVPDPVPLDADGAPQQARQKLPRYPCPLADAHFGAPNTATLDDSIETTATYPNGTSTVSTLRTTKRNRFSPLNMSQGTNFSLSGSTSTTMFPTDVFNVHESSQTLFTMSNWEDTVHQNCILRQELAQKGPPMASSVNMSTIAPSLSKRDTPNENRRKHRARYVNGTAFPSVKVKKETSNSTMVNGNVGVSKGKKGESPCVNGQWHDCGAGGYIGSGDEDVLLSHRWSENHEPTISLFQKRTPRFPRRLQPIKGEESPSPKDKEYLGSKRALRAPLSASPSGGAGRLRTRLDGLLTAKLFGRT